MFYALKLSRFLVVLVFILSNFLPWIKLDDAINSINGIDLAVYMLHGSDKVLFLKQNLIMALGLFLLPIVIIVTTTSISISLIISIFKYEENRTTSNIIYLGRIMIPIIFLLYLAKPFIDENNATIYAFGLPNIGLVLILVSAIWLVLFEIYYNYKFPTTSFAQNNELRS